MENYPRQQRQGLLLLRLSMVILALACVIIVFLIINGYGSLDIKIPSNATITINTHVVKAGSLRIRPGTYQVIVSSPTTTPLETTVKVNLFNTTVYQPRLEQRNANAIASSLLGGTDSVATVNISLAQWFNNNTWVAALVVPSDLGLVLHYDTTTNQWDIVYYPDDNYPADLTKLPANVATYVGQLEAQHAQG